LSVGAASLAVGGAAFALIQILQGTISAFNPRPVVSVLISVLAALVGSTLGRMRQNAVEAGSLTRLLRVWPLTSLADRDALTLGCAHAARAAGRASPIVACLKSRATGRF
jgi:hypothetical protein